MDKLTEFVTNSFLDNNDTNVNNNNNNNNTKTVNTRKVVNKSEPESSPDISLQIVEEDNNNEDSRTSSNSSSSALSFVTNNDDSSSNDTHKIKLQKQGSKKAPRIANNDEDSDTETPVAACPPVNFKPTAQGKL